MRLFTARPNVRCCLVLVSLLANVCYSSAEDLTFHSCADDNHWVYVDGVLKASNTGLDGQCCNSVSVTVTLSTKAIAVQVWNKGGTMGGWRGYFSGGTVVNAVTWNCTTTNQTGWTSPDYIVGSGWRSPAQNTSNFCYCKSVSFDATPSTCMWTDSTFSSTNDMTMYCRTTLPTPCADNPCQNGGTCSKATALSTVATCSCSPGFTGTVCDNYVVPLTISQVSVTEVNSDSASTADVQVTWSVPFVPTTFQQQYYQFSVQFRPAFSESWNNVSIPYQTSQTVSLLARGVPYIFRVVPVRVGVGINSGDNSSAEQTFMSTCTNHKWSARCTQPCGQCSTPQCNTVTGHCVGGSDECLQWYTGDFCNISIVTCIVQDLTVKILTDTSAQVTWTCVGLSNMPSRFYYFLVTSSALAIDINSLDHIALISGALPPNGIYDMNVTVTMCRTQSSEIDCTAGQITRTSCGVPDSPGAVDVSVDSYSIDSSDCTISWTSPMYTRCLIPITYIVTVWKTSMRQKRDTAGQILVYNKTTTDTFVVATLQYNNTYSVSVIAVGPQGSSAPSRLSQLIVLQPYLGTTAQSTSCSSSLSILATGLAVGLGLGVPLLLVITVLLVLLIRAKRRECHHNIESSLAKSSNPKLIAKAASKEANGLSTVTNEPPTINYEELPEDNKRYIYLNDMDDHDKQKVQNNDNADTYETFGVKPEHGYAVLKSN